MVDLSVEYCGATLKNPLICASGPLTLSPEACARAAKAGFSAVVLKTLFHKEMGDMRYKYTRPRFMVLDWRGMEEWHPTVPSVPPSVKTEMERPPQILFPRTIPCETSSHYIDEKYVGFIDTVKKVVEKKDVKVIASIGGGSMESWEELCAYVNSSKADMVELNFGCPGATAQDERFGARIGTVPELAERYTRFVRKNVDIPIIAKLNPQGVPNPMEVAKACERAGADGVTAFDTGLGVGLRIDIETSKILGSTFQPIWGPAVLPYTLGCIAKMRMEGVELSISACYGVWDWKDIIRCIMVGADSVQSLGTIVLKGYEEAGKWISELQRWLEGKRYKSISELKGASLKHVVTGIDTSITRETPVAMGGKSSKIAVVDTAKCNEHLNNFICSWCENSCPHLAIRVKDYAIVIGERCEACGLCAALCPVRAITIESKK